MGPRTSRVNLETDMHNYMMLFAVADPAMFFKKRAFVKINIRIMIIIKNSLAKNNNHKHRYIIRTIKNTKCNSQQIRTPTLKNSHQTPHPIPKTMSISAVVLRVEVYLHIVWLKLNQSEKN